MSGGGLDLGAYNGLWKAGLCTVTAADGERLTEAGLSLGIPEQMLPEQGD